MNAVKVLINFIKKKIPLSSFFTTLGFIFILYLSWIFLSSVSLREDERLHSFLQNQFQTLVSDLVVKKYSEVEEMVFHKIWTKKLLDPRRIKIIFSYSLMTKGKTGGSVFIEGESLLEKSFEDEGTWFVKDFQVTDSLIEFSEPLIIKAKAIQKN